MSQQSRPDLKSYKNTQLADSTSEDITAEVERNVFENVIDSSVIRLTDQYVRVFGTASGTADALTFSTNEYPTSGGYVENLQFMFKAASTNTSTVTINVNGLGVEDLKKSGGVALSAGEIESGKWYQADYDSDASAVLIVDGIGGGLALGTTNITVDIDANAQTFVRTINEDAGTGAYASTRADSSNTGTLIIAHGSGRTLTRYGVTVADYSELLSNNVNSNGLLIGTGGNDKPIIFGSNDTEVMRLTDASGEVLGFVTQLDNTYTPTITNVTNVSSSSVRRNVYYIEYNDHVRVYGNLDVQSTSTGLSEIRLSLPVSATFSGTAYASGICMITDNGLEIVGRVESDGTNNEIFISWYATDTVGRVLNFDCHYEK